MATIETDAAWGTQNLISSTYRLAMPPLGETLSSYTISDVGNPRFLTPPGRNQRHLLRTPGLLLDNPGRVRAGPFPIRIFHSIALFYPYPLCCLTKRPPQGNEVCIGTRPKARILCSIRLMWPIHKLDFWTRREPLQYPLFECCGGYRAFSSISGNSRANPARAALWLHITHM